MKNESESSSSPPNEDSVKQNSPTDVCSIDNTSTPSSNREMRNKAEKDRRDRLNYFIMQLSSLVPMVSNSPKRMDKTSILRLSTTFLRQNQLEKVAKEHFKELPAFLKSTWPQSLLEDIEGVMVIITSAGKIVFVTHNVEKIFGHPQIELLGQSFFNFIHPDDHAELRKALTSNEETANSELDYDSEDSGVSSSESVTNRGPSSTSRAFNKNANMSENSSENCSYIEKQRRSIYIKFRLRSARSEQPQFESVQIVGYLQVPKKTTIQNHKKTRKSKEMTTTSSSNDVFLVGVMKPIRKLTPITMLTMIEEYMTRHLTNGEIVHCSQQIATVSGYLAHEVTGKQAFDFMHQDEAPYVLTALSEMLKNQRSYEKSCYRLRTSNNQFIYLSTHGYLEPNDGKSVVTFVCINKRVSEEEGKREIEYMKSRFSAISTVVDETVINKTVPKVSVPIEPVEDVEKLKEKQFVKAKFMAKALPPTRVPLKVEEKSLKPTPSQLPSTSPNPSQTTVTPSLSPVPCRTLQNRPSVLRRAPPSRRPVTTCSSNGTDNVITSTSCSNGDYDCNDNNKFQNFATAQEYVQRENIDLDAERVGVVQHCFAVCSNEDGVIMSRSSLKRHFDDMPLTTVPIKKSPLSADSSQTNLSPIDQIDCEINEFATQLPNFVEQCENSFETRGKASNVLQLLEPTVDNIERLETDMHRQNEQLNAIEGDLVKGPSSSEKRFLKSGLTTLKEEHLKQSQLLKSIKCDHRTLQHRSDINVNMHQNVGV